MPLQLIALLLIWGIILALVWRRRSEKGSAARKVATAVAVILGLLGLSGVAYAALIIIAINSWANNK